MQPQRLFEIIYLLMERTPRTTAELAARLEVSERTVRRDVDALSAAGVPVYMTRGKGGGVHLMEGYMLDKSVLSEREQDDLVAALTALNRTGAAAGEATERLGRLFRRAPEAVEWLDFDFSFWGAPPDYRAAFTCIRDAICTRHVLTFAYRDAEDRATERVVEPAQLVFKERTWYVRAWCRTRGDWRTFKLFRIDWSTLKARAETFEPRALPPQLSERYTAPHARHLVLHFVAEAERRVREEFAPAAITRKEDGSFRVEVNASLSDRTLQYLLSFGAQMELREPADARTWIRDQALAVARLYEPNKGEGEAPGAL